MDEPPAGAGTPVVPPASTGPRGCDCVTHPGTPATARCVGCGRLLCDSCRQRLGVRSYCPDCARRIGAAPGWGAQPPGRYGYPPPPSPHGGAPGGQPPYGAPPPRQGYYETPAQPPPYYYPPPGQPYSGYPPAGAPMPYRPVREIMYPGATWGVGEVVLVFFIAFLAASAVGVALYFALRQWYPDSPTMANVLLIFLSSVVLYFFLLGGTYYSVKVRHNGKLAILGLKARGLGGGLLYGIGLGLPIFIGAVFLSYITQQLFGPQNNYVSRSVTDVSSGYSAVLIIVLFITLVVLAPVCEEIFFRGYLYPALRNRMDRQPAMLINGLLFAAAHFEWFGFLPRFLLGYGLCYIYEKQGNLSGPITGHALYNGIILLLALLSI